MLPVKRLAAVAGLVVLGLAPSGAARAAAPSTQDSQFLQSIHRVNLSEVSAGKLAQQKGTNQQVKDLGKKFSTDHAKLDQTVQSTASSVGVTLPDQPSADQQAVLNHLKGLNNTAFDTQWISVQLIAHQQAIDVTETEISQGSDPTVKQVAQNALPMLQDHYRALVAAARTLGVPIPETPSPQIPSPSGTAPSPSGTTTEVPTPAIS